MLDIKLSKSDASDTQILTLSGEWDIYERGRVESYFSQVQSEAPEGLIVDLSAVTLLDSSGVEVLIIYYARLREVGTPMVLVVNHNNYLIRKFRNLGIFDNTGLKFFETVEEAISLLDTL